MFDSWLTLSGSGMDLKHIDRVMTPEIPSGGRRGPPRQVRDLSGSSGPL